MPLKVSDPATSVPPPTLHPDVDPRAITSPCRPALEIQASERTRDPPLASSPSALASRRHSGTPIPAPRYCLAISLRLFCHSDSLSGRTHRQSLHIAAYLTGFHPATTSPPAA